MIRAAIAAVVVVLGAGWIAYVHLWRHGNARPLRYRDVSARIRGFESRHALALVYPSLSGKETALLVASGPRSNSGYRLDIVGAVEERDRVVVTVHEHSPTLAHPGRAVLTYPYRLLMFPRTGKHISIHWEGRP